MALVYFLLPTFNLLAETELTYVSLLQPSSVIALIIIVLVIGLLGGSYPAIVLSKFNPTKVLKGNFKTSASGIFLRKGLIVLQFVISVGLIICTLIIRNQVSYIQTKKLGYNKNHVVVLPLDKFIQEKINTLKTEFLSNSNVRNITTCNQLPTFVPGKYNVMQDKREMIVTAIRTDKDFIKTLQLQLLNGSDFSDADQLLSDSSGDEIIRPLIINEAAVKSLGWTNEEAVGKIIKFQGRNSIIKGVVNDFHFNSMHESISPFIIFLSSYTRNILVRLSGEQIPQTLEFLKERWSAIAPHRPFEYSFLDAQFNKLYASETRTGKLFYGFALIAIGLACLGLFGLVAFTAQQRTKEIGIRKVLGASVTSIVFLLSKNFLKMVVIASLIAFPLAWWIMNKWLQNFAYRINISWWMFALAGFVAVVIALFTISFQSIKAAVTNPIKNLRTE
jgi:putative ABC transport system permease protein